MIEMSMRVDTKKLERYLTDLQRKQLPFALASTLTALAAEGRKAEQAEMKRVFARPTRWTINSVRYEKATKRELVSRVYLADEASKGTPASKYLRPQIEGGPRDQKRFEVRLTRAGVLPHGWVTVPGRGERLNQYGNLTQGRIVQILSAVKAFTESGFDAHPSGSSRSRRAQTRSGAARMFVSRGRGVWFGRMQNLPPGVWIREGAGGRRVRPVLLFVPAARYQQRYHFGRAAARTAEKRFQAVFDAAWSRALATAR